MALKSSERVTLSLSGRLLINVEALNMAETVGNVSRHRKAPIVVPPKDGELGQGYSLVYVPAISGESIAHHFQKIFVSLAKQRGLPVPKLEEQGYFLKYASEEVLEYHYPEIKAELDKKIAELVNEIEEEIKAKKKRRRGSESSEEASEKDTKKLINMISMCEAEKLLVGSNAVADVAGFLFTGRDKPSVKRASRIHFSYLIPALETVKLGIVAAQPQIHVRYSPQAGEGEQALFYVEGSSALYTFSVVFVASDVGKLEYCTDMSSSETQEGSSQSSLNAEERKKRVDVALDALLVLLDSMTFGAKRARYLPHWQYDSIVAAVSRGPVDFVVSPASNPHYIEETVERAKSIKGVLKNMNISIFAYARSPASVKPPQQGSGVTVYNTPTDVLTVAANEVRKLMGIAPQVP